MAAIAIAYCALLLMAVLPIYIGSHRSLKPAQVEALSAKDAAMFPIYGSGVLFGLYVVFKLVAKNIIDVLITIYFVGLSAFAVANALRPTLKQFSAILAGLIGLCVAAVYLLTKHWTVNNFIGLSFAVTGIEYISLPSFQVGCVMLCGLFVYDIFWVFGTEVMVVVAKSFNAPVKLLFPKDIFAEEFQFSMLGLGDLVIPGIFIAMMLRLDNHLSVEKGLKTISKVYFNTCFIAYILGLGTCIICMQVWKAAQPALLYLVPYCILSVMGVALVRGEFGAVWAFKAEEEGEAEPEEELPFKDQLLKLWREQILGRPSDKDKEAAAKKDS